MDSFISFFESIKINTFDVIVSVVVLFNIISSTKKGFVLSVISFLKWIIAFVIAKFSIPYVVPYINEIIKNETTARVVSGVTVFLLSLFLIIVLGKAIGKSMMAKTSFLKED
ncbi:MAG: CvpA family protein [Candidatus Fonsibacter ubiquis]|nr:CvpA family protein [Candidatus Fonsibacter ubiquis]